MRKQSFTVTLEQPLVISQSEATAGAHHSLDYLPGNTFLGVVAGRLYPELSAEEAFIAFHSGEVRFGDALPLSETGELARPVPLNWHILKGKKATDDNKTFIADALFDPALSKPDEQGQPKQQRGGYVTASGKRIEPKQEQTLKTAIDPEHGSAMESQLFGYQALSIGQSFYFELQADDTVSDTLWQKLRNTLKGTARIGRSRSAQFGRVDIRPCEAAPEPKPNQPRDNILTLWLQSDLLLTRNGQPCLQPKADLLSLPEGSKWIVEKSFLRSRQYSNYNGYRRHHDPQKQVITRGSVLHYQLPEAPHAELLTRLAAGIGQQQHAGLGRVLVNPSMLAESKPAFEPGQAHAQSSQESQQAPSQPNTTLANVLSRRAQAVAGGVEATRIADDIYKELCKKMTIARNYHATPPGQDLDDAPGRSQWGRLKTEASNYRGDPDGLWNKLTKSQDALLRQREGQGNKQDIRSGGVSNGWGLQYGPAQDERLGQWLQEQLKDVDNKLLPGVVGQLGAQGHSEHWLQVRSGTAPSHTKENQS